MNILVVDDIATNRKLLRITLEAEGYQPVEAADGLEALKVLAREKIDAVISDVLMPNMDGFRLCHEIRKDPMLSSIPFIIYTSTYTSPQDMKLAGTVGANRYLTKPGPAGALLEALTEVLGQRASALPPKGQPDEAYVLKAYSEALVNKLEEKNADLQQALESLRIAHERILELNANLEKRVEERTAELTKALAEVKELSGLLPICCYCKNIRDDKDYWQSVEAYLVARTHARFSHGICPKCYDIHVKPDLEEWDRNEGRLP